MNDWRTVVDICCNATWYVLKFSRFILTPTTTTTTTTVTGMNILSTSIYLTFAVGAHVCFSECIHRCCLWQRYPNACTLLGLGTLCGSRSWTVEWREKIYANLVGAVWTGMVLVSLGGNNTGEGIIDAWLCCVWQTMMRCADFEIMIGNVTLQRCWDVELRDSRCFGVFATYCLRIINL